MVTASGGGAAADTEVRAASARQRPPLPRPGTGTLTDPDRHWCRSLHQPHNLAAIRAISAVALTVPQVACFDTAFHRTQPSLAQQFALPCALTQKGIRRYGFLCWRHWRPIAPWGRS